MTVRQLIQRLTELDRDEDELGVVLFDGRGGLTIVPARDARPCGDPSPQVLPPGLPSDYRAVLIVAGQEQPQLERALFESTRP